MTNTSITIQSDGEEYAQELSSNQTVKATSEQLIIMALILFSIFISLLFKRFKRINRFINEFSVSVLVGLVVGLIIMGANWNIDQVTLQLSPTLFWNLIVPPIIFEAGFNMSRALFFKNFSPIIFLSFFGTIIASLITAAIVFGLTSVSSSPLSFLESMVFGSLISATDPASVLATITGIPVNPNVGMIIFGESAINNAVALIIYRATSIFAKPDIEFSVGWFFASCGIILWMFVASLLIGIACALVLALVLRHINIGHHGWTLETVMVLIFAYSSYLLAELIQYSGIVSILFCGMTMAAYLYPNLSPKSRDSTKNVVHVLSFICQTSLFIYIGLGVGAFKPSQREYNIIYILIGIFAITVARLHVFLLLPITNIWKRASRLRLKHMAFIFLSGLRGGIAFVLAVDLSASPYFSDSFKQDTMGTVLIIILLTVIVMGGFVPLLIRLMRLEAENESELLNGDEESPSPGKAAQANDSAQVASDSLPENSKKSKLQLRRKDLLSFDKRFIRPFFTKPSEESYDAKDEADSGTTPLKSVSTHESKPKPTFFVSEEDETEDLGEQLN